MAKTLVDFRAEQGLYLKDLAAILEISEDELRTIEASGTVPAEIGQRLILHYALPEDYFSLPTYNHAKPSPMKKTPEKPMRYFGIVSFVGMFIAGIILNLPGFLYSMVRMFISLFSAMSNNDITLSETSPIFNFLDSVFGAVVIVLFGIFFVKYITKHTTFEGNIAKYKFFYYSWTAIAASIPLTIASLITTVVLNNVQNSADPASMDKTLMMSSLVSVVSFVVSVLSAYFSARLLNVAAFHDEEKQLKEFSFLAKLVTVSTVITIVTYIAKMIIVSDFSVLGLAISLLSNILPVVVIWLAVKVKPKDEKQEKLIFTILPIIAICDTVVYGLIYSIIGL